MEIRRLFPSRKSPTDSAQAEATAAVAFGQRAPMRIRQPIAIVLRPRARAVEAESG
jgi:hypothetical protein